MIFLFTQLLVAWWTHRAGSGREPATITKLATGCVGMAFAYTMMAVVARMTAALVRVGSGLFCFVIVTPATRGHSTTNKLV
jgi:dipeptide/tripeptide permease